MASSGWALFPVGFFFLFHIFFPSWTPWQPFRFGELPVIHVGVFKRRPKGEEKRSHRLWMSARVCVCSFTVYININSFLRGSPPLEPEGRDVIWLWFTGEGAHKEKNCRKGKTAKWLNDFFLFPSLCFINYSGFCYLCQLYYRLLSPTERIFSILCVKSEKKPSCFGFLLP